MLAFNWTGVGRQGRPQVLENCRLFLAPVAQS
jgi:hypothetical protein